MSAHVEREWLAGRDEDDASVLDLALASHPLRQRRSLKPVIAAALLEDLAAAADHGTPFAVALRGGSGTHGADSETVRSLQAAAARGERLSAALAAHPESFQPPVVALLEQGEQRGDLPGALRLSATALRRRTELPDQLRRAARIPLASTAALSVAALVLGAGYGRSASSAAPGVLLILTAFAALAITAGGGVLVVKLAALAHRAPGLRRVQARMSEAAASATLCWMLSTGATPAEAVSLTASVVGAPASDELRRAGLAMAAGSSLAATAAAAPGLRRWLQPAAERARHGEPLAEALSQAASVAETERVKACARLETLAAHAGLVLTGTTLLSWVALEILGAR